MILLTLAITGVLNNVSRNKIVLRFRRMTEGDCSPDYSILLSNQNGSPIQLSADEFIQAFADKAAKLEKPPHPVLVYIEPYRTIEEAEGPWEYANRIWLKVTEMDSPHHHHLIAVEPGKYAIIQ